PRYQPPSTAYQLVSYCGPDGISQYHAADVARLPQVEYDNRQLVVHAERDGGCIHHLQLALEHLQIRDVRVFRGVRVEHRIGGIDPVHLRAFEDDLGLDLHGAERGRRVGGEVRIPG